MLTPALNIRHILFLTFVFGISILHAQDTLKSKLKFTPPANYVSFSAGAFETVSLSFGIKVKERITAHLKYGLFVLSADGSDDEYGQSDSFNATPGIGAGLSFYFNRTIIFRSTSIDFFLFRDKHIQNGFAAKCVIGDNTEFSNGIGIFAEMGVAFFTAEFVNTNPPDRNANKFEPLFRIGCSYGF